MSLGSNIRTRRQQIHMGQKELADKTGVAHGVVCQVEADESDPSVTTLRRLACALDTTAAELLGDHVPVQAAKSSVFNPDRCEQYLEQMPENNTKRVLKHLAECVRHGHSHGHKPSCALPSEAWFYYTAAKIHMQQGDFQGAAELLQQGLGLARPLGQERMLALACQCYRESGAADDSEVSEAILRDLCAHCADLEDVKEKAQRVLSVYGDSVESLEVVTALDWASDLIKMLQMLTEKATASGRL